MCNGPLPVQTARLLRECLSTYISEFEIGHPADRRLEPNRKNGHFEGALKFARLSDFDGKLTVRKSVQRTLCAFT